MNGQPTFWDGTQPLKITKPIRLIELFAGVGSQAMALKALGADFEHYRICEFDKFAVASYNAIHGTDFGVSDITQISAADLAVTDTDKYTYIMTYSFPCTDLSTAGKRQGMSKGSGTQSGLLWEVERLINGMEELPQILLMENVPVVISQVFIKGFAEWIAFLDSKGYTSSYAILNAKDYGVPQNRERCFMVSWQGDYYYQFPDTVPLVRRLKDVLEPEVDEKYYLSDKATEGLTRAMERPHKPTLLEAGGVQPNDRYQSGRVNTSKSVSKTVRAGGRGSIDRHSWDVICEADGVYTDTTPEFTRPPLKGISRTLKATTHDAGVIEYETNED